MHKQEAHERREPFQTTCTEAACRETLGTACQLGCSFRVEGLGRRRPRGVDEGTAVTDASLRDPKLRANPSAQLYQVWVDLPARDYGQIGYSLAPDYGRTGYTVPSIGKSICASAVPAE